nr:putative capsid [Marmot picobirnavirus]
MKGKNNDSRDYRGKGKKGSYRGPKRPQAQQQEVVPPCSDPTKMNDIAWYAKNPTLLEAVGKISFPYRAGMAIPLSRTAITAPGGNPTYHIPGTMSLSWVPFVGGEGDPSAPANIAGREIFNRVRAAFSGSLDADAPDFMMYFMALDSIFSYIGSLKRVFRIIANYHPDNMNLPVGLLNSMGITTEYYQNLSRDRMQLYSAINELVHMTDKFMCPAVFPVFERHYWLNDNVYADADNMNAQFYVFNQTKYLKFAMLDAEGASSVKAGGLTYVDRPNWSTISGLYNFGVQLINALSAWDDAFIISGYLRRAFEGEANFKLDEIMYNDRFTPVYVPEVLAQIENSFSDLAGSSSYSFTSITQNVANNTVKTNYTCSFNPGVDQGYVKPYLNIRSEAPSITEVTEATRLQTFVASNNDLICGTEAVLGYNIYTTDSEQTIAVFDQTLVIDCTDDGQIMAYKAWLDMKTWSIVSGFDWHPFAFLIRYQDMVGVEEVTPYGDVHNFTTFDMEVARQLNRVCMFSEFNAFGIS